jgi:hypothetical protein
MTTQQQLILDALTTEFARINESNKTTKGFNLINTDALQEHTKANRMFAELSKQDLAAWELAAYAEMERIIELLVQDLPDYVKVDRYDTHIGKYKSPSIQLRHESVSGNSHHESLVSLHINVSKRRKSNEYNASQDFGEGLYYTNSEAGWDKRFKTIEEAISNSYFQNALRNRVIR